MNTLAKLDMVDVLDVWNQVAPLLERPETEEDYDRMVAILDAVLDMGGADEQSPLARLADLMGDQIAAYDALHFSVIPEASGVEVLQHLMVEYGLKQSELPEIGSQGVVSEILSGKRILNTRQIKALGLRFGVPVGMFV